ncbi:MAG: DUF1573 domain-containing protein [Cyclobacteriaceae bacterium]|nr:DUF1573 domain-containing protein [Cyclobacteriaceae bacterium]
MKSQLFLALLVFLSISIAAAQDRATFAFEEETFDFGTFKEENGPVEHKFVFVNKGNAPLIIEGVRASCGCTTPAWSKEPIPPGEKGFVVAKYDPKNRPGSFRKSLTITSNADPASKVIFIQGMVETRPKSVADQYAYKIGDMRFRYQSMNMGRVTTEKPLTRSFDIYNDGEKAITFLDKKETPDFISISIQPNIIEPKTGGKLIVTYNGKMKNDYGYVSDPIHLFTDEESDAEKVLRVVASIEEYFAPLTQEQLAQAPRLAFESTLHDFGNIRRNAVVSTEFKFSNTGKSELNIRAIKPNCACTVVKMDKDTYAPGESGILSVQFDATGRQGTQQKSIVIFPMIRAHHLCH